MMCTCDLEIHTCILDRTYDLRVHACIPGIHNCVLGSTYMSWRVYAYALESTYLCPGEYLPVSWEVHTCV